MAQLPVPRPSGLTPSNSGSTARRHPGSLDYENADAVGFENLPQAVVDALAGVLIGPPIAADAEEPVAKRRTDGTHYQQATGWWAGGDRYITIDARRLLTPIEGQSFKPISGWKIDGTISHFAPGMRPVNSQWRFDPGGVTASGKGERRRTDNPLDVLPDELTAPVRGAEASAWREYGRSSAEETIVAALAAHGRVRVLKAKRNATSRRALETADWYAVTIDAPIVAVQPLATDSTGSVLLGPPTDPAHLAAGSRHKSSIGP